MLLTCPGARGWRQHPPRQAVYQSDPCPWKDVNYWLCAVKAKLYIFRNNWLVLASTLEAPSFSAHKWKPGGCNCHCCVSIAGQVFKICPLLTKRRQGISGRQGKKACVQALKICPLRTKLKMLNDDMAKKVCENYGQISVASCICLKGSAALLSKYIRKIMFNLSHEFCCIFVLR